MDFQLAQFSDDISVELPCGENLEYDPDFSLLERAMQGTPERQSGDSIIPAELPDWKKVRELSLKLLVRSHDIQVCVYLTCALVRIDGFSGLGQSLALIHELIKTYWDDVYPIQDPEDDYPVLRMNILSRLNDYDSIISPVTHFPLSDSMKLGQFSLHDFEVAGSNAALSSDSEVPDTNVIESAFLDTEIDKLQSLFVDVEYALKQLHRIAALTVIKVGEVNAPDLSDLSARLTATLRLLKQKVYQRQGKESSITVQEEAGLNTNGASATTSAGFSQGINNRSDVVRAINEICLYFEQYEPSSPVPFLLNRSKKLLSMNFIEIIQDLTPDAVSQAKKVCGEQESE